MLKNTSLKGDPNGLPRSYISERISAPLRPVSFSERQVCMSIQVHCAGSEWEQSWTENISMIEGLEESHMNLLLCQVKQPLGWNEMVYRGCSFRRAKEAWWLSVVMVTLATTGEGRSADSLGPRRNSRVGE